MATTAQTTRDWLADCALRGLIASIKSLPYRKRVPAMGRLLSHGVGPLVGYRKRAMQNLKLIYPQMAQSERRRIAIKVCDNFGRTLIENYSYQDLGNQVATVTPRGDGIAHIQAAKAAGQPVIFVTGHFGNHEVPRHVLTQAGFTIGGLYRPMGNQFFNDHYAKTMTSWGGPVFAQGSETRGFARHIRAGGMGTLLTDVSVSKGMRVDFMGQPARTSTSAADMALKFGALVVPYYGFRTDDGLSFDVVVEAPITHTDATTMTADITNSLARWIEATPEQWFWIHKRWK